MSAHPYRFLSPKATINLPKYQYNGIDRSLIYKHILSPLAGFLVDNVTPSTLAPNAITLTGLVIMFLSYLNVYYHCPTLEQCSVSDSNSNSEYQVPSYIFLLNGLAMLVYQTLDNMDGKQARKTGSSSPLGLLFDHGCDAINSIFGSVTWMCALGLYPTPQYLKYIWIMVFSPMMVFYIATWEEYYTHKLDLPVFNGPSEGLLLGASFNIVSWWLGQAFWSGTHIYDAFVSLMPDFILDMLKQLSQTMISLEINVGIVPIRNYEMVILGTVIAASREVTSKITGVVKNHGFKTIKLLSPMLALGVLSYLIVLEDTEVFIRNERVCFHLVGLLFVDMVTALMLDHTCAEENKPFRNTLLPLFILHYLVVTGNVAYAQLDKYIWIYTGLVFIYLLVKTKIVIGEICHLLGIWCFDIVTPRKSNKEKSS